LAKPATGIVDLMDAGLALRTRAVPGDRTPNDSDGVPNYDCMHIDVRLAGPEPKQNEIELLCSSRSRSRCPRLYFLSRNDIDSAQDVLAASAPHPAPPPVVQASFVIG
jgi:hypothetical protein